MNKLLKIFLWIILFPFLLTFWGWKTKKKPVMVIGAILSLLVIAGNFTEQEPIDNAAITENRPAAETESSNSTIFEGYRLIEVDGGDLSGHREANVVVDIGFGDREYWAFTNEYGQLVKVIADAITLQDESKEPVTSDGRYYHDEAKVPGTEESDLDEGHVIADSLGGVANAYNITPQNSTLNRHGDQAYMEKVIRDADGCTDFVAIISYPDTETQIPSHYSFTYTLMGNFINDEFDNVDPSGLYNYLGELIDYFADFRLAFPIN